MTSATQGTARDATTGPDGVFFITNLQPGKYNLAVEASGFKKYEQRDIILNANDKLSLGDLPLVIGAVSESVTVEASAALLQTQSADRAGLLTSNQVSELAMVSRNFLDLARTVPGVVYTGGLGGIQANGNRGNQNNLTLDGVTNVDTGSNGGSLATTNVDMISEFKIITNSQPAEFGRSSGSQILVVTKSGTQDLHATGYIFHRNEGLNANTWINNMNGVPRQFYRYNFAGFNVGGPVFIPKHFNADRSKLFFFMGIEWQNQLVPQAIRNVTVPTALERQGDFSKSITGGGTPVVITNPQDGGRPYPNMTIPASQLNADGVKILNWYPLPNALNQSSQYNYQTQYSDKYPRREYIYRGDYNINEKWRVYGRYITTYSQTNKNYGQWNADYNIPFSQMNFGDPGWSFITNVTTIINPTLTNEFIFGSSKNILNIDPVDDTFNISNVGVSYKMPFPEANTLNLVQNWRWGGVPNAPFTGFNGTPFRNFNHTYDITDNMSKVLGTHTMKFGIYIQYSAKDQTAFTSSNGNIWFDSDTSNPNDTNWAWSNALTGTFQRLQQSNVVLNGQYRYWNVEWYAQDNWRVNSKLTIDYGLRFYWIQPQYDQAYQTSSFNPALYNTGNSAVLRQPALDPNGRRVSYNPVTGEYGPAALIGSIVNTGKGFINGLYANGMGLSNQNGYPAGLIDGTGILFAPRLGVAYRFNPKTVVRAGAGIFYDRFQGNPVFDMLPNPPSTNSPTFYYGNLSAIPPAAQGVYFPAGVNGFDIHGQIPTTYNWNLTVEREIWGNVLLDVAYVGSSANHLIWRRNQNSVPLGSAWLPQNQDPLNPDPKYNGTTTTAVNFYRPYLGYAGATTVNFGANSNYNALQVSANRRFGHNVTFGVAYTWSKVLGTTNDDGVTNNPFNARAADYGPLFYDRTHLLVFNYLWMLPRFAKGDSAGKKFLGAIVNDWQISGITTIMTGQPDNITFSINNFSNLNERYTGSVDVTPRVVFNGPANYQKNQYAWMDANVVGLPVLKGSQGFDSAPRNIRRPGDNNWDISVYKNFRYIPKRESAIMQLRLEMFNAPNSVRWSDFNRSANFDALGKITNLPTALGGTGGRFGFGAVNAVRDPRIIQLAAKMYF